MVYLGYGDLSSYLVDDSLGTNVLHFGFSANLESVRKGWNKKPLHIVWTKASALDPVNRAMPALVLGPDCTS